MAKVNTSIRLHPAIHEQIATMAKSEHRSFNAMLELILFRYFEKPEEPATPKAAISPKEEKAMVKASAQTRQNLEEEVFSTVNRVNGRLRNLVSGFLIEIENRQTNDWTIHDTYKGRRLQQDQALDYLKTTYWGVLNDKIIGDAFIMNAMISVWDFTKEKFEELTS